MSQQSRSSEERTHDLSEVAGIKALSREGLESVVADLGEPRFRARQLEQWLYRHGVRSYDEMSNLKAGLRDSLAGRLPLFFPEVVEQRESFDGTRKYLLRLGDGTTVETVGLPAGKGRLTVCFSTQAGCAMACSFCATGKAGLTRDLAPGEMVDQVMVVAEDFGRRVTNVVAMGQGEPFANYDNTLAALRFMNSSEAMGIGARHFTVSTCGILPGIRRFADEPEQFTLAVSLHSAIQETRDRLMPGVRGFTLPALHAALGEYTSKTGRRVSLEFALIAGENDSNDELEALVEFARGMLFHVNLIPINPVADTGFERTGDLRVRDFTSALADAGVEATVRSERGSDIEAACGQLKQVFEAERIANEDAGH